MLHFESLHQNNKSITKIEIVKHWAALYLSFHDWFYQVFYPCILFPGDSDIIKSLPGDQW